MLSRARRGIEMIRLAFYKIMMMFILALMAMGCQRLPSSQLLLSPTATAMPALQSTLQPTEPPPTPQPTTQPTPQPTVAPTIAPTQQPSPTAQAAASQRVL